MIWFYRNGIEANNYRGTIQPFIVFMQVRRRSWSRSDAEHCCQIRALSCTNSCSLSQCSCWNKCNCVKQSSVIAGSGWHLHSNTFWHLWHTIVKKWHYFYLFSDFAAKFPSCQMTNSVQQFGELCDFPLKWQIKVYLSESTESFERSHCFPPLPITFLSPCLVCILCFSE